MPLVGIPFVYETDNTKIYELVERTDNKVIIELDAKTKEAPYSDTFSCKELWIIISS